MPGSMTTIGLSQAACAIFHRLQGDGICDQDEFADLSPHEQAFLIGELYVRTSRYHEIAVALPENSGEWWRRLAITTGYLFTAPLLALRELDFLEPNAPNSSWTLRLKAWRMHLSLLIGFEKEGRPLRDQVLSSAIDESLWQVEIYTLLAISYFSTGESKTAIEHHRRCLSVVKSSPEKYFQSFGAALAMRAALKICDAEAFEQFSKCLDTTLLELPDSRYHLRQLSYRAVILTQLGERDLATQYWTEGDLLLKAVDQGCASVERIQYLTFRLLAASLLGDRKNIESTYVKALREIKEAKFYEVHHAELEICYHLAPLANPVLRAKNLQKSYQTAVAAKEFFERSAAEAALDAVKSCYSEAITFCDSLLTGQHCSKGHPGQDRWRTLTLSVIDNYQNFADFAEKIDYFRLLPKFIHELQKTSLTDDGLLAALARVIKFSPQLTQNGFEIAFERRCLSRVSQIDILLNFANTLRQLYKEREEGHRAHLLAETVQMVAHDFRRPFNLLRMTLQGLSSCDDPNLIMPLLKKALPTINKTSEDVNRMLEDVLDASRPIHINQEEVATKTVVISALESLKALCPGRALKIKADYRSDTLVIADQAKLVRAVTNVLENAVQATTDDNIWIKTQCDTFKERAAISFTIGNSSYIPLQDRKKLFEKFFSRGKANGTGLGLYIVRKIIDEHGGTVRCRSSRKHGTEFDLVVPIKS